MTLVLITNLADAATSQPTINPLHFAIAGYAAGLGVLLLYAAWLGIQSLLLSRKECQHRIKS